MRQSTLFLLSALLLAALVSCLPTCAPGLFDATEICKSCFLDEACGANPACPEVYKSKGTAGSCLPVPTCEVGQFFHKEGET